VLTVAIGAAAVELLKGVLVPESWLHADRDRIQIAKAMNTSFFMMFSFLCWFRVFV
jgi:hypothetical protein